MTILVTFYPQAVSLALLLDNREILQIETAHEELATRQQSLRIVAHILQQNIAIDIGEDHLERSESRDTLRTP